MDIIQSSKKKNYEMKIKYIIFIFDNKILLISKINK